MTKCPLCHHQTVIKTIEGEKVVSCPACGAAKDINPNSGNIVWIKNGRVVLAEEDVREQRILASKRYPNIKALKP